jgi:beta-alanine--pyruvate transaminase
MGAVLVSKAIYETFMQGPDGIRLFHGYTFRRTRPPRGAGLATLDIWREGLLTRAKSLASTGKRPRASACRTSSACATTD